MANYALSSQVQRTFEVDHGLSSRYDYDANGNLIYYGRAYATAGDAEDKWKIAKLTYDANGNLIAWNWAGGKEAFEFSWVNRTALVYS